MAQTLTVQKTTKEARHYNNEKYWGVQCDGTWYDLYVIDKPARGQQFNVEVTLMESNGKTYRKARLVGTQAPAPTQSSAGTSSSPAPVSNGNRSTPYTHPWSEYESMFKRAHRLALELEPGVDGIRARSAICNTIMIAFTDGKIKPPDSADDAWGDTSAPAKHEKTAAHDHLMQVAKEFGLDKEMTEAQVTLMLKDVCGFTDLLALSEKEAIQARLKLEAHVDANTNYKQRFVSTIKAHCDNKGLVFNDEKGKFLKHCTGLTDFSKVDNLAAKKAIEKFNTDFAKAS